MIGDKIDPVSGAQVMLDNSHHELHDGNHYHFSKPWDLGDGEVYAIQIVTPNSTKLAHFLFKVLGALHTKVQFFEGATHTSSTDYTSDAVNRNRNSSNITDLEVHVTGTDGSNGTTLFNSQFGIDAGLGFGFIASGGESRNDQEWLLASNCTYLILITSLTAANAGTIIMEWYEYASVS